MKYGYIRVSSADQCEDRQRVALQQLGLTDSQIYFDCQSGKDFRRPEYKKLLRHLHPGDTLYIPCIDRLGRNYAEILEQWRILTHIKHIDIVVLDMPLLNTRRGKDLLGTFLSDIVLQILSFTSENERAAIRCRQAEGIAAARARGVRFGRPQRILPPEFLSALSCVRAGSLSWAAAARSCNLPLSTFRRRAREIPIS